MKNVLISSLLIIAYLIWPNTLHSAQTAERKIITIPSHTKATNMEKPLCVLINAYKGIEIDVIQKPMGMRRALVEANVGRIDGTLGRVAKVGELYGNLVMVPESIGALRISAFATQKFDISKVDDLSELRVAILYGSILIGEKLEDLDTHKVVSEVQLVKMLIGNRVDVIIANRDKTIRTIHQINQEKIEIFETPMFSAPLFHFLHKDHIEIVDPLENSIKIVKNHSKASGCYSR